MEIIKFVFHRGAAPKVIGTYLQMKCNHCSNKTLIRKGKRGIKQRYQCKSCNKYQQDIYSYKMYDIRDDIRIKVYNSEGVGVRSMSRILGYSAPTIIRRILYLASKVTKPIYSENNQIGNISIGTFKNFKG